MTRRALTNKQGIQRITKLVNEIYKEIGEPLPHGKMMREGVDNYTDSDGAVHFTKMLRNAGASQRLFSVVDRFKDLVFSYQYLNGQLKLESSDVSKDFLYDYIGRNLAIVNTELIRGLMNFLSYYYDLDSKDENIDISTFKNLLYIKDFAICMRFEGHILNHESFATIEGILGRTLNNYEGLATLNQQDRDSLQINALKPYPIRDIVKASGDLAKNVYDFLKFFLNHIKNMYHKTKSPDSPNDYTVKVDSTGAFKRVEDATEPIVPVKIYNLTKDTFNMERNNLFVLYKNRSFRDLKDQFYRNGTQTRTTFKMTGDEPFKIEHTKHGPQEGGVFWTHTLMPLVSSVVSTPSKFLVKGDLVEDVTLLLTLMSGRGVYTNRSSLTYSHKTSAFVSLRDEELNDALNEALDSYDEMNEKEAQFMGLILTKYREALQPMSANFELIRYWEIIDTIADFYAAKNDSRMKPIPKDYVGREEILVNEIKNALKEIEEKRAWNLTGENSFTPIFLEKGVSQKILDTVDYLELESWLGLNKGDLKPRIKQAYRLRSKYSHSANVFGSNEKKENLGSYYIFSSQLAFLMILKILKVSPTYSTKSVSTDIGGFIKDKNHYHEKNKKAGEKQANFEQFMKYFSGKEEWPDDYPRSFTF